MSNGNRPLALTQRVTESPQGEKRDGLAQDWTRFLKILGCPWLALPNDPETALELVSRFEVGGLILTGGDDIGVFPERDQTEAALLGWAGQNLRPVLGICRGFQFIHHWLGGDLVPVEPELHRARRHEIIMADGRRRVVNSFHNFAPDPNAGLMEPLATCVRDGALEAAGRDNCLGLMWHPEREPQPRPEDLDIIKRHFDFS